MKDKDISKMERLWDEGYSGDYIAKECNCSRYYVYKHSSLYFKKRKKKSVPGIQKLYEKHRKNIEFLYFDKKYKMKSIANRYNVTESCIGIFIRKGERYKSGERRI